MASIEEGGGGGGHKGPGVKKQQRKSTLVDMTPLVDLGFLLITFFIFTTTMSQPAATKLTVPKKADNQETKTEMREDAVLNIVIGDDDKIATYEGQDPKTMKLTDYKKVRDVIMQKKQNTDAKWFSVIIRPVKTSKYKHTVDILDEISICQVGIYSLIDATSEDEAIIKTK